MQIGKNPKALGLTPAKANRRHREVDKSLYKGTEHLHRNVKPAVSPVIGALHENSECGEERRNPIHHCEVSDAHIELTTGKKNKGNCGKKRWRTN
jgi:hypothetical protein